MTEVHSRHDTIYILRKQHRIGILKNMPECSRMMEHFLYLYLVPHIYRKCQNVTELSGTNQNMQEWSISFLNVPEHSSMFQHLLDLEYILCATINRGLQHAVSSQYWKGSPRNHFQSYPLAIRFSFCEYHLSSVKPFSVNL